MLPRQEVQTTINFASLNKQKNMDEILRLQRMVKRCGPYCGWSGSQPMHVTRVLAAPVPSHLSTAARTHSRCASRAAKWSMVRPRDGVRRNASCQKCSRLALARQVSVVRRLAGRGRCPRCLRRYQALLDGKYEPTAAPDVIKQGIEQQVSPEATAARNGPCSSVRVG